MSVLVYAESPDGQFKKSAFEVVSYGKRVANQLGGECIVFVGGSATDPGQLKAWGGDEIIHAKNSDLNHFDNGQYASAIAGLAKEKKVAVVVVSASSRGKALLGRLAVKLNAGSVSGVNSLPDLTSGFHVSKSVFSGKAFAKYSIDTDIKVMSLMGNSIPPEEQAARGELIEVEVDLPAQTTKFIDKKIEKGTIPLPEAELVVSAGRGMKGPENWGIVEELADTLGATTACSRPVADADWRPHHEHVGQTGVAIRPNLYIAIGISGAIQHLAGVNNSKVIVVINKDPEAPFFKAADYGVVGDLFEIVPKLTKAINNYKGR
jgi:electron transfer flavoprotein alpha subunit